MTINSSSQNRRGQLRSAVPFVAIAGVLVFCPVAFAQCGGGGGGAARGGGGGAAMAQGGGFGGGAFTGGGAIGTNSTMNFARAQQMARFAQQQNMARAQQQQDAARRRNAMASMRQQQLRQASINPVRTVIPAHPTGPSTFVTAAQIRRDAYLRQRGDG